MQQQTQTTHHSFNSIASTLTPLICWCLPSQYYGRNWEYASPKGMCIMYSGVLSNGYYRTWNHYNVADITNWIQQSLSWKHCQLHAQNYAMTAQRPSVRQVWLILCLTTVTSGCRRMWALGLAWHVLIHRWVYSACPPSNKIRFWPGSMFWESIMTFDTTSFLFSFSSTIVICNQLDYTTSTVATVNDDAIVWRLACKWH